MKDNLFSPNDVTSAKADGLHEKNTNLKSIDEHENRMQELYRPTAKIGVGVACPKCGTEMYDDSNGMVLTSYPPRRMVACTCGHSTSITC